MPPKVFWAPMLPMIANFAVQMASMIMVMGAFPGKINPLTFMLTFTLVHVALVAYGVREPHMSKIMQSRGPFIKFYQNVYKSRGKKLAS